MDWRHFLQDDPSEQTFRVRRDIFSDQKVFDLEIARLFEGGWIYLAHESQIPGAHDYLTVNAGRRPLVLMRDADGEVRAFHNACPHRGAMICPLDRGNARLHVCPYHGWSFTSDGRNKAIKARAEGRYAQDFLDREHNLVPIARFGNYRGFLFGSLTADCETLAEHLGDARVFIDLMVDQSPDGLEIIPGVSAFTYEGNWKHQLENCSDGYHVTSVHPTYIKVAQQRAREDPASAVGGVWDRAQAQLSDTASEAQFGTFTFANGHAVTWSAAPVVPGHPLFASWDMLVQRVGETRALWMFYARNVTIFPNLQFVDNFSSQIRVLRPLAPGRTEMTTFCVGPSGEAAEARRQRLRQYEDFFMPSGMATPDDLVVYEDCQAVDAAAADTWQSYARGMNALCGEASPETRALDIHPETATRGSGQLWDETAMHAYYRAWRSRMDALPKAAEPKIEAAA